MHASVQENSLLSLDWHLDAAVFLCSYYPISLSRIFFSYDGIIKYYDALEPFQWLCTCTPNGMKHSISRSQPKYPKTLLLKTYFLRMQKVLMTYQITLSNEKSAINF